MCLVEQGRLERIELSWIERAELERDAGRARNDVEGARLETEVADRGHAPGKVPDDELVRTDREGRRGEARVQARVHRRRARVTCEPTKDEREGARADDARDEADLRAHPLEARALLDVELHECGK